MPSKKLTCPTCGGSMSPKAAQCRKCKPTYERTPEQKAHMSAVLTGKPKPALRGRKRPEVGKKIAEWWTPERREEARKRGRALAADREWRLRIARALSGENNPRWMGGITGQKYAPGFSKTLKGRIRARDGYSCQLCGTTEDELGYALSIHHADYDKTNHDELNLFATCKRCNSLVNTNRQTWRGYFTAIAEVRRQFGQDISQLVGRKVITQREGVVSTQIDGGPDLTDIFGGLEALP